jgi:hypothetical protein
MKKTNYRHIHAMVKSLMEAGKAIPHNLRQFLPRPPKKPGAYRPGGPDPNVRGTYVRNPAIAAQVNAMHEKWLSAFLARKSKMGAVGSGAHHSATASA